jgi:hypothetical protein
LLRLKVSSSGLVAGWFHPRGTIEDGRRRRPCAELSDAGADARIAEPFTARAILEGVAAVMLAT